jgi:transcriptional regulator with XRE-family HTH domain
MTEKKPLDPKTETLLTLMRDHGLTARQVAVLVGRSRQAVKRWMCELTVIDQAMLDLLHYRLRDRTTK